MRGILTTVSFFCLDVFLLYFPFFYIQSHQILFDSEKFTENTQRVLGERRLKTLREFGTRASQLEDVESACRFATGIPLPNLFLLSLQCLVTLEREHNSNIEIYFDT